MAVKTDVLVIGGGPVGLHSAYALLQAGRSVTLLDQAQAGVGSGSGNAGHIVPSHIVPLAAPGVVSTALRWMLDPPRSPFGLKVSLGAGVPDLAAALCGCLHRSQRHPRHSAAQGVGRVERRMVRAHHRGRTLSVQLPAEWPVVSLQHPRGLRGRSARGRPAAPARTARRSAGAGGRSGARADRPRERAGRGAFHR